MERGQTVYGAAVFAGHKNWEMNTRFDFMGRKWATFEEAKTVATKANVEKIYYGGCRKVRAIVYTIENYLTPQSKVTETIV